MNFIDAVAEIADSGVTVYEISLSKPFYTKGTVHMTMLSLPISPMTSDFSERVHVFEGINSLPAW